MRQDAWTQDEDLLLAEVVLRHIREGGTQLQAFKEVGKQLSRTSAACGFRWNSYVRKQYKSGIELSKKLRKELKQSSIGKKQEKTYQLVDMNLTDVQGEFSSPQSASLTFEQVLQFLTDLYQKATSPSSLAHDFEELTIRVTELEEEKQKLVSENEKLTKELTVMQEDYKALIEIMEKARKMVALQGEDRSDKVRFQMDKNGNLERMEK